MFLKTGLLSRGLTVEAGLTIKYLRYVWNSTNRCNRSKISSISEFFRTFKDLPCRQKLTNLDAKGAKRSIKIWTTNFYKSFFKNMLLYKISLSTYVCYAPDGLFWLNLYIVCLILRLTRAYIHEEMKPRTLFQPHFD